MSRFRKFTAIVISAGFAVSGLSAISLPAAADPVDKWGVTIWNPASAYVPNYLELFYQDDDENYGELCDSGLTASCDVGRLIGEDKTSIRASGRVYLDPCTLADEGQPCIEDLKIGTTASRASASLQVERPFGGFTWSREELKYSLAAPTAQDIETDLPVSGQPSLWFSGVNHSGAAGHYTAMVSVEFNWDPVFGIAYRDYAAAVIPVKVWKDSNPTYGRVNAVVDEGGGFSWSGGSGGRDCAWHDQVSEAQAIDLDYLSICAERHEFSADTIVELSVRLPSSISGWYKGRVTSPTLSVSSIDGTEMNLVTVAGSPSYRVPQLEDIEHTREETPQGFRELFDLVMAAGGGGHLMADDAAETVEYIQYVKDAAGDKATKEVSIWQFGTLALPDDECYYQRPGLVVGMVSTDAMTYGGTPPVYEGGVLKYSVAGMHKYSDNETEVSGSYDLLLEAGYARCLYELGNATLSPTVTVFETSTDAPKTGARLAGFSEADGWMNFNVTGITFSNPTIAINFGAQQQGGGTGGGVPVTEVLPEITTPADQPDFKVWAKRISETEAKIYARNPIGAGKVQFFVNGKEVAWIRAENSSDRKLRRAANGFVYLVRTINLEPGKNRIEIQVDGVRQRFVTYTG
jgi:hypothetical protein